MAKRFVGMCSVPSRAVARGGGGTVARKRLYAAAAAAGKQQAHREGGNDFQSHDAHFEKKPLRDI